MTKKRRPPATLEPEASISPSSRDTGPPITPNMAARADGACVVTRSRGVVLFSHEGSTWRDEYVATGIPNQQIAIHPTDDRFVVWTAPYATIVRSRVIAVCARRDGAFEKRVLWESPDATGDKPEGACFVGDRVVALVQTPAYAYQLRVYAPVGDEHEKTEELQVERGVLVSSGTECAVVCRSRLLVVSFADGHASLTELPLEIDGEIESAAMSDHHLVVGMPRTPGPGIGRAALFTRAGAGLERVAVLEPERARKHAQFARMVSLCGDRFVLASGGLERVPKSHNEFVPSESVTSLYDSTGALLARREARPLREEGVRRPYSHTQVTRDFVLEFRPDSDVLEVYRIPAASGD